MASHDAHRQPDDVYGLVGNVLENKFRVERVVAEGGFGLVYYAVQLALEKPVALKLLKLPGDLTEQAKREFADKFAMEARTVARLNHPNIVQAVDFGISWMPNGMQVPWMALEWAPGRTLSEVIQARKGQGYTPQETIRILRPVLQALGYAHDAGIAHRDIKPSNIMVTETRRDWLARLMDFGIAKVMTEGETVDSGETKTANPDRAFSLRYAAPEQLSGTRSGPWTDVHAMALIVLELLTGNSAYGAKDMTALYGEILNPQRPTPRSRALDAGAWELVLTRALAINPAERFHHAADFLAALEAEIPAALRPLGSVMPGHHTAPDGSGGWNPNADHTWMPPGVQRPTGSVPSAIGGAGTTGALPAQGMGTGPGGVPMGFAPTGQVALPPHMAAALPPGGGIPTGTIPPALMGAAPQPTNNGARAGVIVGLSGAVLAALITGGLFLTFGTHRTAPPAPVSHAAAANPPAPTPAPVANNVPTPQGSSAEPAAGADSGAAAPTADPANVANAANAAPDAGAAGANAGQTAQAGGDAPAGRHGSHGSSSSSGGGQHGGGHHHGGGGGGFAIE